MKFVAGCRRCRLCESRHQTGEERGTLSCFSMQKPSLIQEINLNLPPRVLSSQRCALYSGGHLGDFPPTTTTLGLRSRDNNPITFWQPLQGEQTRPNSVCIADGKSGKTGIWNTFYALDVCRRGFFFSAFMGNKSFPKITKR